MAQHIEINPDPKSLPLSLADRAMAMARGMQTSNTGTIRVPTGNGNAFIAGKGAQDGANWIDANGKQLPLIDTSRIEAEAESASKKADEAIKQGEQIRRDAQAGIDDARKAAQDAAVKADKVRTDIQAEVDANKKATDSAIAAVDKKADKVRTDLDSQTTALKSSISAVEAKADQVKADADKLSQRVDADKAALDKSITDVDAKAQAASDKGDRLAGRISDVTTTVNGHTTKLGELSTRIEGVASDGQATVKSLTDLRQTVTGLSSTVSQNTKTASDAMSKVSQVEQTANGISATLSKNYTSTADADKKYAAKTELKTTADGLQANITKSQQTADGAVTAANKAQATADGINATLSKDYQTAKDSDAKYSTKAELKATSEGLSSSISSVKQTADGAVTAASKAQQTADGISLNLGKNYATKAQNNAIYATQSNLKATSDSLTASINSTAKTAQSAVDKTTSLEANLNGFKTSVAKTYQDKAGMSAYATTSQLQQTADSIKSQVSAVSQTASGAMSKATSLEQTTNGLSAKVSETAKTLDATVTTANEAKSTADSNKQTISQVKTTADGAVNRVSSLEQNLSGFKQTVSQTYTTKTDFNNLTIGGTNLLKKTSPKWSDWITITPNIANFCVNIGSYTTEDGLVPDAWYSSQIELEFADVTSTEGHKAVAYSQGSVDNGWTGIFNPFTESLLPLTAIRNTVYSLKHSNKARNTNAKNKKFDFQIRCDYFASGKIRYRKAKWEVSSKPTDWSPAPEDLQPAGDYATNSSLTQTANSIKAQVTEVSKTANSAMSKATTVEQTANGLSSKITEQGKTLNATVTTANEAKSTADSNKTTISQVSTTASNALSKVSTVEQNLNGFKTAVSQTYGRGSNLWVNPTFDPDKPQIGSLVDNVIAPNGSRVNLLANRYHFNAATDFPVVPGHTYVITAYCKPVKGNMSLRAGIWYTKQTGGHSFDGFVDAESTSNLGDGWMTATWRFTCPGGKSRGCVYFQIENWPPNNVSTQWLVANVTCTDVTGLQPAGDYATNSSLSQTADSIRASVTENARRADAAMSKASSVEQTASGLSTRISEVARKGDRTVQSLNSLQTDVTGFKQTVQQTYATGSRVGQLESSLDGFKSTVSQTYSPKSEAANLAASTVRRYTLNMTDKAAWHKIGYWQPLGQGSVAAIHVYTGAGTNGREGQNSEFTIMLKKGWVGSSNNHRSDYGVNLIRQRNAANVQVKAFAYHPNGQDPNTTPVDIWIYQPWGYGGGHYDVSYDGSWTNMTEVRNDAPGEDSTHTLQSSVGDETLSNTSYVDQTSRSVSLGVVEEYKQGQHGSALATSADITAAKNSITSSVSSTYATKTGVTQEISSKITQNNNSLDVRFSTKTETKAAQNTANTANSHASDAQSRVGSLESCIRMTSAGVRVGHIVNGAFQGYSALLSSSGSFDVLDSNSSPVARFDAKGLTMTGGRLWLNGVPQHRDPNLDWEGVGNGGFSIKLIHFGGRMFLIRASATVRRAHVGAADYKITNALPYSFIYTRIAGYLHVSGRPVGTAFGLVDGKELYISTEDYGNEVSQEISGVAIVSGL